MRGSVSEDSTGPTVCHGDVLLVHAGQCSRSASRDSSPVALHREIEGAQSAGAQPVERQDGRHE